MLGLMLLKEAQVKYWKAKVKSIPSALRGGWEGMGVTGKNKD